MSELSKQALKVENNSSFPNNNSGLITPQILRDFNVDMIDSLVDQIGYDVASGSWNQQIDSLEQFTASASGLSTGSLLVTASAVSNVITFTKGNGSTFNVTVADTTDLSQLNQATASLQAFTASATISINNLNTTSASVNVSITNLNASSASQQVSINALNTFTASQSTASLVTSITNLNSFTSSANVKLNNIESTTASLLIETSNLETFTASALVSINELNAATASYVTETESGSFLITASFASQTLTFTKGDNTTFSVTIPDVSGSTIDTGSFATTGSNVFTGDQTFTDASDNFFTITDTSGSMMLVAKGYTSASAHITSSAASKVNIIFKNNNNTGTIYLSGSNNIFTNPDTPTAGFKRILGSNNINLFVATPQVSASMGDYVSIDNNFLTARNTSPITVRGPISSSAWEIKGNVLTQQLNIGTSAANHAQGLVSGLFVNNCYIGATLAIVANRSNMTQQPTISNSNFAGGITLNMNSSSIDYVNNVTVGGSTTINNNTTGSARATAVNNAVYISSNIFGGNTTMTLSGSNDPNDTSDLDYNGGIVRSLIFGNSNAVRVNTGLTGSNTLAATTIIGNSLIVTGSSQNIVTTGGTNLGSAFFGRYNAVDGNRALSAQTIFAVGTGTSTSVRKTGFLIDSGSNSFFEGTVNVSGSLSVNGIAISSVNTSSFATTGSNQFNGNQTITGSLTMTGSILFVDRSGNSDNVYLGTNALGMGGPSASPNALGNTIAVAIGNGAMQYASGSNQNVAIGNNALQITTGSKNIAVGSEALSDNTTGNENIGIGAASLTKNTTGEQNVGIGFSALTENITGAYNLAIGSYALSQNISSSNSVAIGYNALQKNQSDAQTAIGVSALKENTVGERNLAIGYSAAQNNTIGDYNTAIGGFALYTQTGSQNNIAIGYASMEFAESTQGNTAIGNAALYRVKANSNNNVAIGKDSLREYFDGGIHGGGNMAIGNDTMRNVVSGSANTAIGSAALRDAIEADENVFIGWTAGLNAGSNANGNVYGNTVIGSRAGQAIHGERNTLIGWYINNLNTGSFNTLIGAQMSIPETKLFEKNTLVGSLISSSASWTNVVGLADGDGNFKFFNSGSQTTLTNNTLISGSLTTTGSMTISGSAFINNLQNGVVDVVVTYNASTGELRKATIADILSSSLDAAEFYSTTTQSGSAGVSGSITFNNSGSVAGVSLVNSKEIKVSQAGTYNIQFSAQVETSAGADTIYLWYKKNGTNILASASKAVLANNTAQVITVNLFDEAVANDYYELAYQTTNGNATVLAEAASGNIPAIPSVILTIQQIR